MALTAYRAKRDFKTTREPSGRVQRASSRAEAGFVVQKHAATRLHYDFRLEMDGVLKSWAVPKGFPTRKGDRRLAVEVEDHPLDYADFEGVIPEGNYGAGTVIVWDRGVYSVPDGAPLDSLRDGKLRLRLQGSKLDGEWTLVRMKNFQGDKPQWLLLKSGEDEPEFSPEAEHRSAITGRTLEEVAAAKTARQWSSNRRAKSAPAPGAASPGRARRPSSRRPTKARAPDLALPLEELPREKPQFHEPMKALLAQRAPAGDEWVYEVKFDGIRALAVKKGDRVALYSRAGNDLTARFDEVASAVRQLPVTDAALDGEIAALDEQGRTSFQLLQSFQNSASKPPLAYYVFDALNLDARNIRRLSLDVRKAAVQTLLEGAPAVLRYSPGLPADPKRVLAEMQSRGLEGLIAKKRDSVYEPGRRSGCWLKVKWALEQEFVIGGYSEPRGARTHFGALLVGYYEKGRLLFAAKVGTGFDQKTLLSLHRTFQPLVRPSCPFVNLPEKSAGRFGGGLTASEMRRCTWLEPRLVCQVRFAEWTRDNHLRQPAFLGLREDKRPEEVVREVAGNS